MKIFNNDMEGFFSKLKKLIWILFSEIYKCLSVSHYFNGCTKSGNRNRQGCMQKCCKGGGGGGRTCGILKMGTQLQQRQVEHWKTMFKN